MKSRVRVASGESSRKVSSLFVSLSLLVVVLLIFCVVQLTISSILSPRGKVLMEHNSEKDMLVEENRLLEQKIAERAALRVIDNRAQKELDMERVDSVMYLRVTPVSADAATSR